MKTKFFGLFLLLSLLVPGIASAQDFINLTPKPKTMNVGTGELVLPQDFSVSAEGLSDEMKAEVAKFVEAFNSATGYHATVSDQAEGALMKVSVNTKLAEEGYSVKVTTDDVTLRASTPAGLFFAFQTIKKVLPPNVMAGVQDPEVTTYALPVVTIADEPRFAYRGFMLDVSRHFFTVEDVKRMLEVMSYYKMNSFHWHLTDDQGWRVEIKKYPKLTTVGATAPNSYFTDMDAKVQYWINRPYGPYFYTQEEIRDVVAYAKERHIRIIPEIDMPGHFVAAMAAYPEYSCWPDGSHQVWDHGGISTDVLNVANPKSVQFVKDILTELMELFPDAPYINIGGDECPTSAWQGNAQCQALYNELGLTDYHQLQSRYMNEIGKFIREKGHNVAMWNEVITAANADTKSVSEVDPVIYCWTGADAAANKAADLKLKAIYTPQAPYYINRTQRAGDPPGAGYWNDDVKRVYEWGHPVDNKTGEAVQYYIGVQGTFWCEHVSDRKYMEWLALPRLTAIAEAGWTPKNSKSFADFQKRMTADAKLLNYNNYQYTRHHFLDNEEERTVYPKTSTDTERYYYRLTTRATADATRAGSCIELLREGSPLIKQWSAKGAQAGRLWANKPVAEGAEGEDWQLWAFEEDPENEGMYALVCKAQPEGSVNATPTVANNTGRWNYDANQKNYNFILGDNGYGDENGTYYYSIRSNQTEGMWMNAAASGQGYSVNCYGNPADGNSGHWLCTLQGGEEQPEEPGYPAFTPMEVGKTYVFENTVKGFEGITIADDGTNTNLTHSQSDWASNVWTVTNVVLNEDNSQTVQLQNLKTQRFIGAIAANRTDKIGFPVSISTTAADMLIYKNTDEDDFTLSISGKNLFPLPYTSPLLPGVICSGNGVGDYNAIRPMGAAWAVTEVRPITYVCKDTEGNDLGTFVRGIAPDANPQDFIPEIVNHALKSIEVEGNTATVTYERNAYTVTIECRDTRGALIEVSESKVNMGESLTVNFREIPYFTYERSETANGSTLTPDRDTVLIATYSTEAYSGVKAVGGIVTEPVGGRSYLIYDNSPAEGGARKGFRKVNANDLVVNRSFNAEDVDPYHTWTLEGSNKRFKVKNEYVNKYVPTIIGKSKPVTMAEQGGIFTFSTNNDGTWQIKGSNNICWDGVANGNLVGWDAPGHPHVIYEYYVQPYFTVEVESVDQTTGTVLASVTSLVKAGTDFTPMIEDIAGYDVKEIEGGDKLASVDANIKVKVICIATGISSITAGDKATNAIHDLSGRKLTKISKPGLYIVNGRKVLVK